MKKGVGGWGGGAGRARETCTQDFGNPEMLDGKTMFDGSGCKMQPASFFSAHSHMYTVFNLQYCF
jgi:hypothetical protein